MTNRTIPVGTGGGAQLAASVARLMFLVYLFFIFFGTSLPFRPEIVNVEDKATSNAVNKLVFSSVFIISCLCICPHWRTALQFIGREKFLTLFLVWCLLSMLWSEFSSVTFKRTFQLIVCAAASLAVLLNTPSSRDVQRCFEIIAFIYLPLSILAVALMPGAIDPKFSTWRGLAPSKNHLGQVCVVSTLVWFRSVCDGRRSRRMLGILMLGISLLLLAGSQSMTSMLTLLAIAAFCFVLYMYKRIMPPQIARTFTVTAVLILAIIAITGVLTTEQGIAAAAEKLGKDGTFSGRTELWQHIWNEAGRHSILGTGLGGFWVADNPEVLILYEDFVWLPNQAHMGFLDVFNETGAVGLLLLASMVISYFVCLRRIRGPYYWHWFVAAALIINLQETTLFRPNFLTGVMFMFAYMTLYTDLMTQASEERLAVPSGNTRCICPTGVDAGATSLFIDKLQPAKGRHE